MDFQQLKVFLQTHEIPVSEETIGFLEIIGKQHHENINSTIYAHFINCGHDVVRNLFVESLCEIVSERSGKILNLKLALAQTEVYTGNGRIDILISDQGNQNAIIIENKIYHFLGNELIDYWQHVKQPDDKKVGVLLTLYPHEIPENVSGKFINVTHIEWIKMVKNRLKPEILPYKYAVYISDFISTIENLTGDYPMNESVKFYFQHAGQILAANQAMRQTHDFINNQFEIIAKRIGWTTYGGLMDWRNFWDERNKLDTYLTIIVKDLLKGKLCFTLILELGERDIVYSDKLRNELKACLKTGMYWGKHEVNYIHLICKNYEIELEDLEHFADFAERKIREDFAELTHKAIKCLYPETDISHWEKQFIGA